MRDVIFVAFAGALGALGRWGVTVGARRLLGGDFPLGTLVANVVGCLALGFAMQWTLQHPGLSRSVRLGITVGFLGAFTTFSTFGYETVVLAQEGRPAAALLNVLANVLTGVLACLGGGALARALT